MKQYISSYILLTVFGFSQCLAQQPNNNIFTNGFGLNIPGTASSVGGYGSAASMSGAATMIMAQSEANINNQTAISMQLDNRIKYTNTYFQNRQLNGYYRDLEEWQKKTKKELKASGLYDREAIRYLYGM
jgi:hypothetical protein